MSAPDILVPAAAASSRARFTSRLWVRLQSDPAGVVEVPALKNPQIVIHSGPSVYVACKRGGKSHSGLSVHGDVDLVPAGIPCRWELREKDTALILDVHRHLLHGVAEQLGFDPKRLELMNRFQMRDPQIEHIGWTLKAEMDLGYPNGNLYTDSLATALAVHLIRRHSDMGLDPGTMKGGLSGQRLRRVLSYIEDNLSSNLSLIEIASIAGLSVSHCKAAFRDSVGAPVHQYVVQRRVERAKVLLSEGTLTISEIALETGFSHQSHLAYHVRRLLGVSPTDIRRSS
jgi:AraC family transcriptional regulator